MTDLMRKATSPEVLKNEGIATKFYAVTAQTNVKTGEVSYAPDKTQIVEMKVRFTNWHLHLLEDQFSTLANYTEIVIKRPYGTCIKSFSIIFGWDEQRTAAAMFEDNIAWYCAALTYAFQLSLGTDPKVMNDIIEAYVESMQEPKEVPKEITTALMQVAQPAPTAENSSQNLPETANPSSVTTASSDGLSSGMPGFDTDANQTSFGSSVLASSSAT
jgi:hypothetical protein